SPCYLSGAAPTRARRARRRRRRPHRRGPTSLTAKMSAGGECDFVALYYRANAMSLDEDEFSEFAANSTLALRRALGAELGGALLLDLHWAVEGVFAHFDALVRGLDPLRLPEHSAPRAFASLLEHEPLLALAMLQTTIHTLLFAIDWSRTDDVKRR